MDHHDSNDNDDDDDGVKWWEIIYLTLTHTE